MIKNTKLAKVAVIIPAYNEELTICDVIKDFSAYKNKDKYQYKLYVIDNNSSDQTKQLAIKYISQHNINAEVLSVKKQGKANAIRFAFRNIEANCYVMVDADCTYWAHDLDKFIDPILSDNIDMVIGDRISTGEYDKHNERNLHQFGNRLVKKMINYIFSANLEDIMTGYRSFSKFLVKNYPITCEGFELETDISIFCLAHRFNIIEVPIKFTNRPSGSFSKLNTISDGIKVLLKIVDMFRIYRPLQFFTIISIFTLFIGLIVGSFPIMNYVNTGYVSQVPMAILAVGLVMTSVTIFAIGVILSSIKTYHNMHYELNLLKHNIRSNIN